jgi:5-methylthioadenosine/S-adenosylhomocysteine deaminase
MPLDVWLRENIWPAEAAEVSQTMVYRETKKAISEMRKNGTDGFVDMYFFQDEVARAAIESRMPVYLGEGILDFPTPSARTPSEALARTEELAKRYTDHEWVAVTVAPHSIYALSEEYLLRSKRLALDYGLLWQIHAAETKKEREDCLAKHGLSPVAYLDKLGLLDQGSLLAHGVWLDETDVSILAKRKSAIAHCPLSNLKLGSGIAPVAELLSAGVPVLLGTDGAASSNRLDVWEAGKFAALLQKGCCLDASVLPAAAVYDMMGAATLRFLRQMAMPGHLRTVLGELEGSDRESVRPDPALLYT